VIGQFCYNFLFFLIIMYLFVYYDTSVKKKLKTEKNEQKKLYAKFC